MHENKWKDILKFVEEGEILTPDKKLAIENIEFIEDFELAMRYAFEQEVPYSKFNWVTVKEEKKADLLNLAAKVDKVIEKYILEGMDDLSNKFNRTLYKRILKKQVPLNVKKIRGEIPSDLSNCVASRLICERANIFYELLFEIYEAGYWPCGWKGNLPDEECSNGNWLVYKSTSSK